MLNTRNIYILAVSVAIVAAFSSFFSNEVNVMLFLFAIVMDLVENRNAINSRPLLLLLVFYFISFIYVFGFGRGHFSEMRNILLSYSMMLMCFWIAPGLIKLNRKEARFIWFVFLLFLAENLLVTIVIGQRNGLLLRYYFSGVESDYDLVNARALSRLGMLSYSTAHLLSLLCPLLVVKAFEANKLLEKLVLLFLSVLGVYVMYLTTITTALLVALLFIAAIVVFYFSKGRMKRFILLYSVMLLLLLVSGGLVGLLSKGAQGDNYEVSQKLNDVVESIVTGKGQGQVAGRESEYNLTWEAIARNPIIGGANGPDDTGQHALFFDYWAYYGVFCLFLFIGWWKEVKRMKKMLDRQRWNLYMICLLPVVLLCFLKGPFFLPYYIMATIVILRIGFMSIEPKSTQVVLAKLCNEK